MLGRLLKGQVTDPNNDPPPSYESVAGKIGAVRANSSGNADFIKNLFCCVFCGTVCTVLMLALFLAVPITNVVIGAIYKEDCPREKQIPNYLIVAGSFGIVKALVSLATMVHKRNSDVPEEEYQRPKLLGLIEGPISCFLMAWFIAGNVWIFRIHGDYQSVIPFAADYCNETLYLYSFWSTITIYIFMGVAIVVPCIFACIACCFASAAS